jgi:prepilin peptidase CpaA
VVTHLLISLVLFAILCTGAATDLRQRRIPNILSAAGIVLGLLIALIPGGVALLQASTSVLIALFIGFPFFAMRAMGAGDVKFMMAAGAFFAPSDFFVVLAITAVAGGVLAVVVSAHCGLLLQTIRRTGLLMLLVVTGGRLGARSTLNAPGALAVPYGVAIAIGAGATWLWMTP